jgi:hypothetical protein
VGFLAGTCSWSSWTPSGEFAGAIDAGLLGGGSSPRHRLVLCRRYLDATIPAKIWPAKMAGTDIDSDRRRILRGRARLLHPIEVGPDCFQI